jgi:aspartyl-tRNA(Asn)/glutamyl-tRNA(Gln) amidotransferase subunit A
VNQSIAGTARAFRAGEYSPVEITQECLRRIAELDEQIQAFAAGTAERAVASARAAEAQVRDDRECRRPLLGIPIAVKDNIDVAGVVTRAGSDALPAQPAARDATVWARLDAAGAVMIGKSRTHELAFGVATPPTRNPLDPTRMPGGSSGGSAAALAAGMCLGAIGTDTAGSIRIPAGLCGLVGLKPTRGLCPTDGIVPLSPTLDHVGPIARTPEDARIMLAAMAGVAVEAEPVDLRGMHVGVAGNGALLSAETAAALEHTINALAEAGCVVADADVPSFDRALWNADRIISVEAAVAHEELLESAADRLWPDTRRKLESALRIRGVTYYRACRHMEVVRRGFDAALGACDVLLAPGVASPAPVFGATSVTIDGHDRSLGDVLCRNMAAMNLAGLPAIALPVSTGDGLPVGIQLIGRAGDDDRLLAVAAAVADLV